MSNAALTWAFDLTLKPATVKFTLVVMADRVDQSLRYFESETTIVRRTGLNRKTAISAIRVLQDQGLITDTGERVGRTGSIVVYRLNMPSKPKNGTAKQSRNRDNSSHEAVPLLPESSPVFDVKQSQKRDTDPNRTQSTPNKMRKRNDAHPLFGLWYSRYPLKKSRAQASRAFSKLNPDEGLVEVMIEALERQTLERQGKRQRSQFVPPWKYPATWLNNECWLDEPDEDTKGDSQEDDYAVGAI